VGNVDGVFINNWIEGVGTGKEIFRKNQLWPSQNGFFFEISKGVICAGNVFVNNDHGIMILNSSDAHIYNNTLVNSMACIARTARSAVGDHFDWHPATGPDVNERVGHVFRNNLMTGNAEFDKPLFFVWQPANLCDRVNDSQLKEVDYNVFVRSMTNPTNQLIYWSPAENSDCQAIYDSPGDLHKTYSVFSVNSRFFDRYNGPLFKSHELKNYQLLKNFPATDMMAPLPANIKKLSDSEGLKIIPGAYPLSN
jgi:parallel beta-helix repeat protein